MWYVVLRALLSALCVGALGAGVGLLMAATSGCAGPACAGLILIPIGLGIAGAVLGGVLGVVFFWIRLAKHRPLVVPDDVATEAPGPARP